MLLDDYRPGNVSFARLLRLLDSYKLKVPVKGGFVTWSPKRVYITTPHDPTVTFAARMEFGDGNIDQLLRRITKVIQFPLSD